MFLRMLLKIQAWYRNQEGQPDLKDNADRTNHTLTTSHTYKNQNPIDSANPSSFDTSEYVLTMPISSGLSSQASEKYSASESQFTDNTMDTTLAEEVPVHRAPQDYLQAIPPPLFGDEMDLDLDFFSLFTGAGDWQQQMR